ncbi:MAG TPA: glycine cleavage T C-terminal barrel domain-containing protein [Polyangiaceae bacterium]|nr:glycine cleavage T C-terminal barrel domain-containing protein [Polyangiaceae bacterium]
MTEPNVASGAGVWAFAAPWLGSLVIAGADRVSWLNGLSTCEVAPLQAPHRGAYGLATSKVGRILSDLIIVSGPDRLYVAVPRDREAPLAEAFERYLVMEDAELSPAGDRLAWLLLHGPGAADLAADLAGRAGAVAWAPVDLTGRGGAALAFEAGALGGALEALRAAGVTPGDEAAWEALRHAWGVPRFGVDFDEKSYPQEAGLEKRAVSFQKGCYLGQEVVCRLEMRGHVHRKLVSLALEAAEPPERGAPVHAAGGEAVGAVTSAARGEGGGPARALAMIKYAHAEKGEGLSVGGVPAQVVRAP